MNAHDQSGSLLLESVLASALLAIFSVAILSLTVTANQGTGKALNEQDTLWRAQEGLEALRTIPFDSLVLTDPGSLSWSGSSWILGSGSENLAGDMTRTVRVQEVERDADCVIVLTGSGTVDPDTLALESEVQWIDPLGRAQNVLLSSIRTRYLNPQGSCFVSEQASQIGINLTLEAEWFGLKQLRTLYLENLGTNPVTIGDQATWNNTETMDQLFIDTTKVWSATGPGSPGG